MRFKDFLSEMAKRVTPDDFYKMAVKKYGAEKVRSVTMPEVVAVAKDNDVQVPGYVVKNKVGRAKFDLLPKGTEPTAKVDPKPVAKVDPKPAEKKKSEPSEDDFKAALRDVASAMKASKLNNSWVTWRAVPEKIGRNWGIECRDWGHWENPDDARDEEDYDWQKLTRESLKVLREILVSVNKQHPGIDIIYTQGEKNWIQIYAVSKLNESENTMKMQELLTEAKVKWVGNTATVNGRKLQVKFVDQKYQAFIDGELVRSFGRTGSDEFKARSYLENEAAEVGEKGTTVKTMSNYVKSSIKSGDLNGWALVHVGAGDFFGKNKSKAFSVEYEKEITAKKEWVGKGQFPSSHRFVIQAHFEPHLEKNGMVTFWLAQGGQIISLGVHPIKFKNDDLDDMLKAIKKMMATPDEQIIRELYKSGYNSYGRS